MLLFVLEAKVGTVYSINCVVHHILEFERIQ